MKNLPLLMFVLVVVQYAACDFAMGFGGAKTAPVAEATAVPATQAASQVWVSIPDGSLSCGVRKGDTLEQTAKILEKAGIKIFASKTGFDGLMHVQVCGTSTGKINSYLIAQEDLSQAKKLGFTYVK